MKPRCDNPFKNAMIWNIIDPGIGRTCVYSRMSPHARCDNDPKSAYDIITLHEICGCDL